MPGTHARSERMFWPAGGALPPWRNFRGRCRREPAYHCADAALRVLAEALLRAYFCADRGQRSRPAISTHSGIFSAPAPASAAHVAVGTYVSSHAPRPDPYVRLSRIRLLPRVDDGTSGRMCSSAFDTRTLAQSPVRALPVRIPLGPRPSLHQLRCVRPRRCLRKAPCLNALAERLGLHMPPRPGFRPRRSHVPRRCAVHPNWQTLLIKYMSR